jgi:hypothetical protein
MVGYCQWLMEYARRCVEMDKHLEVNNVMTVTQKITMDAHRHAKFRLVMQAVNAMDGFNLGSADRVQQFVETVTKEDQNTAMMEI